jgi:hypothetical protein
MQEDRQWEFKQPKIMASAGASELGLLSYVINAKRKTI